MVQEGKLAKFKKEQNLQIGEATLIKIGLHAFQVNLYLHEFFEPISFFDPHGLKSMVQKGNLAIYESSNISETGEATATKIGVHAFDINPYLHEFFELIPID